MGSSWGKRATLAAIVVLLIGVLARRHTSAPPSAQDSSAAIKASDTTAESPAEDIPSLGRMALTDADPDRRVEAITSLSDTGDPEAVPYLRQALSDPDASVRLAVLESLAEADFAVETTAELLSSAFVRDPDAENRFKALEGLSNLEGDHVTALAEKGLNDPDEGVRALAHDILSRSKADE